MNTASQENSTVRFSSGGYTLILNPYPVRAKPTRKLQSLAEMNRELARTHAERLVDAGDNCEKLTGRRTF